jgi:isocitrate lyase
MEQLADLGFKYMFMTLADNHAGRNGSWEFFMDIRERGIAAFPDLQHRETASKTPTKSHNQLAGTKAYFVGGKFCVERRPQNRRRVVSGGQ